MILVIGICGAILALVVAALYSLFHVLGRIAGITNDHSHFFIGLGLSLVAFVGALFTIGAPLVGAVLMAAAAIGLFFILGWWAVITAPLLLWAAYLAYRHRDD
jgi:hypothetical protein